MTRNLKALGLALAAVFAFGALSASAAPAATDHFTSAQNKALLTGFSNNNVFELPGGVNFRCSTSKFAATIANGDTQATVDVSYTGTLPPGEHTTHCNSSAGTATIHMNECDYVLQGATTQSHQGKADAPVWVVCPQGKEITITSSLGPVIHVPPQTPTEGGVSYETISNHEGSGKTGIKVNATATGITATCTGAFACGLGGIPSHSNKYIYTGSVNITGYEDIEGLPTPVTEGPKINVGVQTTP